MSRLCICVGLVAVEVLAFEVCQKLLFLGSVTVEIVVFRFAMCRSYGFLGCVQVIVLGASRL